MKKAIIRAVLFLAIVVIGYDLYRSYNKYVAIPRAGDCLSVTVEGEVLKVKILKYYADKKVYIVSVTNESGNTIVGPVSADSVQHDPSVKRVKCD